MQHNLVQIFSTFVKLRYFFIKIGMENDYYSLTILRSDSLFRAQADELPGFR